MRIRTLATLTATATAAAAAIGFAPAASATTTSTTYPWTLSYQTASATGKGVSTPTVDNLGYTINNLVVTGTLTNTGSGCYEVIVDNYLGGFGYNLMTVGGICGPGSKAISLTVSPAYQPSISLCAVADLNSACASWGPTNVSLY